MKLLLGCILSAKQFMFDYLWCLTFSVVHLRYTDKSGCLVWHSLDSLVGNLSTVRKEPRGLCEGQQESRR